MPNLHFSGQVFNLDKDESVLDALLRQGQSIPHGCKAGACQTCIMRVEGEASIPAAAQAGLKDTQKNLGYILSCSCKPSDDLNLTLADQASQKLSATVVEKSLLNPQVLRLRLATEMSFRAGQYLNIWLDETNIRSYSIASTPAEGFIELHIKLIANGVFSQMAAKQLREGDELTLQGPLGDCIYTSTSQDEPLLLAGIGTGLAPLYGIIKDAIASHHKGPIFLLLGAKNDANFYLQSQLQELSHRHPHLTLNFVAQTLSGNANPGEEWLEGDIYQIVKSLHPNTKGYKIFLCGAESFVRKMKKQCFLAGAAMNNIHADSFLPCA